MKLARELSFRNDFENLSHEALLNVYYAASLAKKKSAEFFHGYGLTDVQFNLMMLLHHQGGDDEGLSQIELSRMMLVNRANITAIIDRMEKAGLVTRTAVPGDRRSKAVRLTEQGRGLLLEIEEKYIDEVDRIMGVLDESEQKLLMSMLERIREQLRELERSGAGRASARR